MSLAESDFSRLLPIVRSTSGKTNAVESPLDGSHLADVPISSTEDVENAFRAARDAQEHWKHTSLKERSKILLRYHDLLFENQEVLMDLVQLESGKVRSQAFEEILHVALTSRYYARRLKKLMRTTRRLGAFPVITKAYVNRVPKGVVGIISPWNYPLTMAMSDGLPAIVAGNAVVHKPDSQSVLTAAAGIELLYQAGLPRDLWQLVSGEGSVVGSEIINKADYVCFTGSTKTGRLVAKQAAERLINVSLELGGKNAGLVLADADPFKAAADATNACFSSAGQLCVSLERIYVNDAVYDRFAQAFVDRTNSMTLSTHLGWGGDMGSLVSARQLETVESHVNDALDKGATLLAGGKARPDLGPYVFEPTILTDVTEDMECYRKETFGPVVSLYRVSSDEEAIDMANDSEYGLNATIFTSNAAYGRKIASRIQAGTVNVNEGFAATFASLDTPMGGFKSSGMGRRQAEEGIWRYTESQAVASQSVMPISGPDYLTKEKYAKLMAFSLKLLRKIGRP